MNAKQTILAGAIFSFLSVAIGAFAAHGLKLEGYAQGVFETGAKYQFYHSLALILVGILGLQKPTWVSRWIGVFFTAGIIIFSGSLYILAITGLKWLGAITPIGGICFLIGWMLLILKKKGEA